MWQRRCGTRATRHCRADSPTPKSAQRSQRRAAITTSLNQRPLRQQMNGRSSGPRCVRSNSPPASREWPASLLSCTDCVARTQFILQVLWLSVRRRSPLPRGTGVFTPAPLPLVFPWRLQRSTDSTTALVATSEFRGIAPRRHPAPTRFRRRAPRRRHVPLRLDRIEGPSSLVSGTDFMEAQVAKKGFG